MSGSIDRQIEIWKTGALSEIKPMRDLLETGNPRQALFWAHLAVEKAFKAHVTKATAKIAPFTHSLIRLAQATDLPLNSEQHILMAQLEGFQRTARYDDPGADDVFDIEVDEVELIINASEKLVQWLIQKL